MNDLVTKLQRNFPDITFTKGDIFTWSPHTTSITYRTDNADADQWSLLHELGHAVLQHNSYNSDMQLLKKEAAAWSKAEQLAPDYGVKIDPDHIQDCLDSYREWLHKRSTCPTCNLKGTQKAPEAYYCLNCKTTWRVTSERFCRPYRRSEY